MQDKYVGDIGDFGKYSLLNALSAGRKLGVAWYKYPNDDNNDGKHVSYLDRPKNWRHYDPDVFDGLQKIVSANKRLISEVEKSRFFKQHIFASDEINLGASTYAAREKQRLDWFERIHNQLQAADIIFADPDNGILKSESFKLGKMKHGKSISEEEIIELSGRRPMVVYHHNSRFKGGHEAEIKFWQHRLGTRTKAIRFRYGTARTYFLLNFDKHLEDRAVQWTRKNWHKSKVQYIQAL